MFPAYIYPDFKTEDVDVKFVCKKWNNGRYIKMNIYNQKEYYELGEKYDRHLLWRVYISKEQALEIIEKVKLLSVRHPKNSSVYHLNSSAIQCYLREVEWEKTKLTEKLLYYSECIESYNAALGLESNKENND